MVKYYNVYAGAIYVATIMDTGEAQCLSKNPGIAGGERFHRGSLTTEGMLKWAAREYELPVDALHIEDNIPF